MRQIILDTETTGLSPQAGHRIIEIGCLEMINRRITGSHLNFYINPERHIERVAAEVHGITDHFLLDKPLFATIADELINYIQGAELVIHNAPFDVAFLDYELNRLGGKFQSIESYCTVVDTLVMARRKHPGQHNNLDALCRRYHVDRSNRHYHGALLDAELLVQVYLLMTGGQTQLFGDEFTGSVVNTSSFRRHDLRVRLPVLKATAEEVKAHQALLHWLRRQGRVLWPNEEEVVGGGSER